jgi:hypothetical protein
VHTGPCSDFGGPAGNSMVRRKPGDTIPISLNSAAAHLLLRVCGWVAVGGGPRSNWVWCPAEFPNLRW